MFVETVNLLERSACECCGAESTRHSIYVSDEHGAHAAVLAYCYPPHGDEPSEIWLDVVLGTWGSEQVSDHITFGCRYGPVEGQREDACSLVDAAQFTDERNPILGRRLSREEALVHTSLPDFWRVVDLVLTQVPAIGEHRARFHDRDRPLSD